MNNYVLTIEGENMQLDYSEVIAAQAIRITELEAQLEAQLEVANRKPIIAADVTDEMVREWYVKVFNALAERAAADKAMIIETIIQLKR